MRHLIVWVDISHQRLESLIGYYTEWQIAMNDPSNQKIVCHILTEGNSRRILMVG
jgi:hypothetical protein